MTQDQPKRLNIEAIRKRQTPLAKVLDSMIAGKTARDVSTDISEDIAIALAARNKNSSLGKALDELEESIDIQSQARLIAQELEDLEHS